MDMAGDLIGTIGAILVFVYIIAFCCLGDSSSSSGSAARKRTPNKQPKKNTHYNRNTYSECPSCGAPHYDGYCDECGYPDINQGWLGENY